MAGGVYVGGKLWQDASGTYYYSSGRYEHDTRDDSGAPATMLFTNTKLWLAQWGISHWGQRVKASVHAAGRGCYCVLAPKDGF